MMMRRATLFLRALPALLLALTLQPAWAQSGGSLEELIAAEATRQAEQLAAAQSSLAEAESLAADGLFSQALGRIERALNQLPPVPEADVVEARLLQLKADISLQRGQALLDLGDVAGARAALAEYVGTAGNDEAARSFGTAIADYVADPANAARVADPGYAARRASVEEMLARGTAQYIAGDTDGAIETFRSVEAIDPNNAEAKYFQARIARELRSRGDLDHWRTREQMLQEVGQAWQRPQVYDREDEEDEIDEESGMRETLAGIQIPRVNFNALPLSRVVETLSLLSEEYDAAEMGVNVILIDPQGSDPLVTITLRNLPLNRVLDFVVESVGYEYELQPDAVIVRSGSGTGTRLETEFFPLTRSTIIRLTGVGASLSSGSADTSDPFALPADEPASGAVGGEEEDAIKNFLQRAGVAFDTVPGANLALADGQIIVTNTTRNLERVRNILRRYSEIKQVEIEAKFLEVEQGDLEELGFQWSFQAEQRFDANGMPILDGDGSPSVDYNYNTNGRDLGGAFSIDSATSSILINRERVANNPPPVLPGIIDLAADVTGGFANFTGILNGEEVNVVVRALSRQTGNDLMTAPRVTVLSGKTAEISVGQELLYPESYGDMEAEVSTGDGLGSSSVAITAGTPQDFLARVVGVEMEVTPLVEDDNSISLLLEPKVTEFEGFVEYGGPSVALVGDREVIIPTGFYQPIFNVRRVRTEVTIWDGATVVMGGLTREEVLSVSDSVPVLGDIPLVGRLFRSEGETEQKRNLLIFVTANLISPGGSPARQDYRGVEPGSLFQNPTIVTPSGTVTRGGEDNDN